MPPPYLTFCPYLSLPRTISFADWEIGPLPAFAGRWTNSVFERQGQAFLGKFLGTDGTPLRNPSLLCRRSGQLDGVRPTDPEIGALETAIAFAFLDENPRRGRNEGNEAWRVITSDNAEVHIWPVDVENGFVTVASGIMLRSLGGGYRISDPQFWIRAPLELQMPGQQTADSALLEAVYRTTLSALASPGSTVEGDRMQTAIGWFIKTWRNSTSVHFPERVVFLKTAFEALTGTSSPAKSRKRLRKLFETLNGPRPSDAEQLVWSPEERAVHAWEYKEAGVKKKVMLTELELWFMRFTDARNTIIHEGIVPSLEFSSAGSGYNGHYVFTAEYLFRAAVKALLSHLGYPHLWRSPIGRAVHSAGGKLGLSETAGEEQ